VTIDGAKVAYDAAKGFVYKLSGKKDIALTIAYKGFAELRQHFESEAPAKRPTLTAFWPGTDRDGRGIKNLDQAIKIGKKRYGYLLTCMTLIRVASGDGGERSPSIFTLTVHLHATREIVAVIGTDYWEAPDDPNAHQAGLDFDRYAQTYVRLLRIKGRLDASSPLTIIDCQRGVIERWMRCGRMGYRRQYPMLTKDPPPKWPKATVFLDWRKGIEKGTVDATKLVGALDVYKYLSERGAVRPGTVVDFSVFSHAYYGGPVLFNTVTSKRRCDDLDMRNADFLPENAKLWTTLPNAFASSGAEIHIWGCLAKELYRNMAVYLASKSRSIFKYKKKEKDKIEAKQLSRDEVVQAMKDMLNRVAFAKNIAMFTSVPTYGAPPGYGADTVPYNTIPGAPARYKDAIGQPMVMVVKSMLRRNRVREEFASPELGSHKFDEFGYMVYPP
jgi:hypothetical protein